MTVFDDQGIEKARMLFDQTALDAFGRQRISGPQTIFDYQSQYDEGPLLWENNLTGSGTATHNANKSAVDLATTTASGDKVIRQTRQYHRYQPGKSQLVLMTFVLEAAQTNLRQRVGYFDGNDGIFLEVEGTTVNFVRRTSTSGSAVDNEVPQSSWNMDQLSGLDLTKAQILIIDMEWLGVGSVRVGFVIDGEIRYCHQFRHANVLDSVYMKTANLPVRYEIENTSTVTGTPTLSCVCASVISEGGFEVDRGLPFCSSNGATLLATTTRRPILSIRPKATFNSIVNRAQFIPGGFAAYSNDHTAYIEVVYDGTLTGASFASVDGDSMAEADVSATAISGGHVINAIYVPAASQGNQNTPGTAGLGLLSRLPNTLDISGANPKVVTLVATSVPGTSTDVGGIIYWQELR